MFVRNLCTTIIINNNKFFNFDWNSKIIFQLARGEADLAAPFVYCNFLTMRAALCPPSFTYAPFYWWTAYPRETTKLWNLLEMMDPPTYSLTFLSMIAIVAFMKFMTKYGTKLGISYRQQEILFSPIQYEH